MVEAFLLLKAVCAPTERFGMGGMAVRVGKHGQMDGFFEVR
jgi:hypothetical protein